MEARLPHEPLTDKLEVTKQMREWSIKTEQCQNSFYRGWNYQMKINTVDTQSIILLRHMEHSKKTRRTNTIQIRDIKELL